MKSFKRTKKSVWVRVLYGHLNSPLFDFRHTSRPGDSFVSRRSVNLYVERVIPSACACWVRRSVGVDKKVTWLILPVVICLSQRLSHACLSINNFILWNCERLIISAIIYLMVSYYMDNCSNSRANTCVKSQLLRGGMYLLDKKPMRTLSGFVVNHSNFSNRMASRRR